MQIAVESRDERGLRPTCTKYRWASIGSCYRDKWRENYKIYCAYESAEIVHRRVNMCNVNHERTLSRHTRRDNRCYGTVTARSEYTRLHDRVDKDELVVGDGRVPPNEKLYSRGADSLVRNISPSRRPRHRAHRSRGSSEASTKSYGACSTWSRRGLARAASFEGRRAAT